MGNSLHRWFALHVFIVFCNLGQLPCHYYFLLLAILQGFLSFIVTSLQFRVWTTFISRKDLVVELDHNFLLLLSLLYFTAIYTFRFRCHHLDSWVCTRLNSCCLFSAQVTQTFVLWGPHASAFLLLSISAKVFEVFVQPDTANHLVLEKGGKAILHRCFRA